MRNSTFLSVIIPVYNGERYLARMIKQLRRQTFEKFEVIFVDDGSTDNTFEMCRNFAIEDSNIHIIHIENSGVSYARNAGIKAASGSWIQFIDVDDIIHENMFSIFSNNVEISGADLLICGCIRRIAGTAQSEYCGPSKNRLLNKEDIKNGITISDLDQYYLDLNKASDNGEDITPASTELDTIGYFLSDKATLLEYDSEDYDLTTAGLQDSILLKDAIDINRAKLKRDLRLKWFDSTNATLNAALYRLVCTEDEKRALSSSAASKNQQNSDICTQEEYLKSLKEMGESIENAD